MADPNDALLAVRDRLDQRLRSQRIVASVGLTRCGSGDEHLLVLAPNADEVPATFEGVPVTVRIVGKAVAQLA